MEEFTARSKQTGDKIYLVKEGKKHWIRNPQTLFKLGFKFGDEKVMDSGDLFKLEVGESLDHSEEKIVIEPSQPIDPKDLEAPDSPHVLAGLNYRRSA